jgi:hypothetical protein
MYCGPTCVKTRSMARSLTKPKRLLAKCAVLEERDLQRLRPTAQAVEEALVESVLARSEEGVVQDDRAGPRRVELGAETERRVRLHTRNRECRLNAWMCSRTVDASMYRRSGGR